MPKENYDPKKAHDYYERTKHLKGRKKGGPTPHVQQKVASGNHDAAQKKVAEIEAKLNRLRDLLREKLAAAKPDAPAKKPTQADKLKDQKASEKYRNTHKQQIKNLQKSKGSGGGSSPSGGKTAADMSVDELRTAIRNTVTQLKSAIAAARGG